MNSMRLPKFSYHEPTSLGELLSLKQELKETCALLAGGTDLIPTLKRRNRIAPHILNIKRIPERVCKKNRLGLARERVFQLGAVNIV